jgi:putative transposase
VIKTFIDDHRHVYGVESICKVLRIAPSTYYQHTARKAGRCQPPARAQRDESLRQEIRRLWEESLRVYGARKVWRQLQREGVEVARCTVERLMWEMGLCGVVRGKSVTTTVSDKAKPCPEDRVNRHLRAERPNALWVCDFTYVSTWQGFVYVAFVIDVFARRIVGWNASNLEMLRRPIESAQYVSIRYSERLKEAGIEPSVGSVGDSYDNALAETINGLYKAQVIHRQSWKSREAVELAALAWVDWFNHRRLLEPIGNVPPAEAEAAYYQQLDESAKAA